ncbi:MAG: hypothetical protein ACTS73_00010 [Arsenophonus sp. NEOnobi-MAG3]
MADGIYSPLRQEDRFSILVIIGVTEYGYNKVVTLEDGYQELEAYQTKFLNGLRAP